MPNEQEDMVRVRIERAQEALQRLVGGQNPSASKLSDRRDFADWELTNLLLHLIPTLPQDLQAEVQACYDLYEQVWSFDYYKVYYETQQKTSPICLPASDSL